MLFDMWNLSKHVIIIRSELEHILYPSNYKLHLMFKCTSRTESYAELHNINI